MLTSAFLTPLPPPALFLYFSKTLHSVLHLCLVLCKSNDFKGFQVGGWEWGGQLENRFRNILSKWEITNKELGLVRFLNINCHGFNENKVIRSFVNLIFRHGLIPTVKKLTRITASIHHNFSNKCRIRNRYYQDISDHFSICFIFKCLVESTEAREESFYKRNYSSNSIETLEGKLSKVN